MSLVFFYNDCCVTCVFCLEYNVAARHAAGSFYDSAPWSSIPNRVGAFLPKFLVILEREQV